jgi:hypothetical protein
MISSRSALFISALLMGLAFTPVAARADSTTAQELATAATKRLYQGDRRGAIELLEKAYAADPDPDYLLRIADNYEALAAETGEQKDLRLALQNLGRCLSAETNPVEAATLKNRMRRLRRQLSMEEKEIPEARAPAEAAPEPKGPVPVEFVAKEAGESVSVSVAGQSCVAPCTLKLEPGPHVLIASGAEEYRVNLLVPKASGAVSLPASGDRYLLPGVALTVAGALIATTLWSLSLACPTPLDLSSTPCETANLVTWPVLGSGMFIAGIAFLGYYGTHRVTRLSVDTGEANEDERDRGPHFRLASLGIQPLRSGAAAGIGFSF